MSRMAHHLSLLGFCALSGCSSDSPSGAPAGGSGGGADSGSGGSTSSSGGSGTGTGGSTAGTGGSTPGAGGSTSGGSTGAGGSIPATATTYTEVKGWIDGYKAAHPGADGDVVAKTPAQLAADPDAQRLRALCGPNQLPIIPELAWEYGGQNHAWINPGQSPLVICVYIAVNPSTEHWNYDAANDHITADAYVLFPEDNPCKGRTGADQVLGCIGDPTNLEILVDTSSINDGADVGLALANSSTDIMLVLGDGSKVLLYQNI
jgi:hypothetical protein